ncbi:MAG: type III-B CRISPR module-associated protein Cmr5 [Deltaproteobacteria bacterium]|nr:type III-B CRISPR module-associated protein Cmr5 [Deltaproteobacteria bacterium]
MEQSVNTSIRKTTEQRRARQAWQDIIDVKNAASRVATSVHKEAKTEDEGKSEERIEGEYKSLARSAPTYILVHGVGQLLAFLKAKGYEKGQPSTNKVHAWLYQHISSWVCRELDWGHDADLLTKLIEEDATTSQYRRATIETLAYLEWLKRFAEAELRGGE